ncbi:MAG: hypothetical protein U0Y68_13635 [Blastocatellia bacterium]
MTGNPTIPPSPMALACPTCARGVYRLSLRGRLARWRAYWTKQLPFACASCGWQGRLKVAATQDAVIDELPWFRAREPKRHQDKGAT